MKAEEYNKLSPDEKTIELIRWVTEMTEFFWSVREAIFPHLSNKDRVTLLQLHTELCDAEPRHMKLFFALEPKIKDILFTKYPEYFALSQKKFNNN